MDHPGSSRSLHLSSAKIPAALPTAIHEPLGFAVKLQEIEIGPHRYIVRSLRDRQQFADARGEAEAKGISSASWSHFGQLWPAGLVLAEHVNDLMLHGQRVLEVGCGLAIPGIVLHRRGGDVTVCDHHPECSAFLGHNLRLNGLGPLPYQDVDWTGANPKLGTFDLFIASDVLYERTHPQQLVEFIDRHANARTEVVIVDPRRGQAGELARRMVEHGFVPTEPILAPVVGYRILRYCRG